LLERRSLPREPTAFQCDLAKKSTLESTGTPAQHYQDGQWRQAGPFAHRRLDFGPPFGKRFTVPVTLPELHTLPDTLPVRRLATYQAGFNPVLNLVLLLWKLLGLSRSARGRQWGSDLFLWANRRFSSPPYGIVVLLEATGQRAVRDSAHLADRAPARRCVCCHGDPGGGRRAAPAR
jgi:hypothetical protein